MLWLAACTQRHVKCVIFNVMLLYRFRQNENESFILLCFCLGLPVYCFVIFFNRSIIRLIGDADLCFAEKISYKNRATYWGSVCPRNVRGKKHKICNINTL